MPLAPWPLRLWKLGNSGTGAAVADAIYKVTDIRASNYLMALDKLIDRKFCIYFRAGTTTGNK
jgi:hypothetical protein